MPIVGSVALGVGGLWGVDVSQSGLASRAAVNAASVTIYLAMIVLYGTVTWTVRAWRRPGEPVDRRTASAVTESMLVGMLAAPAVVAAALVTSCTVLGGCTD